MMDYCKLTFLLITFYCPAYPAEKPQLDYIEHYDELSYDREILHTNHMRFRRSVESQETSLRLSFYALNRKFKLRLKRDKSTFTDSPELIESNGNVTPLDISYIYQGDIEGEAGSYVHGSVIDGIFAGRIDSTHDGVTYYVDKSEQHIQQPVAFHSIVYREDHVHHQPIRMKRSADAATMSSCGMANSNISKWMEDIQNSAVEKPSVGKYLHNAQLTDMESFKLRYRNESMRHRIRRQANSNNRLCTLLLQSDPMLWNYMTNPRDASQGSSSRPGLGYDDKRAREEITALFASHVDGIKKIYQNTEFKHDGVGPFRGFTFAVYRIQINETAVQCSSDGGVDANPFCKPNIDVSNFLNLNSLSNHDMYCLAYVFTYRDFTQGTLGLAWVGSSLRASGGLCERWKEYNENNKRIFKSLNTGIVTLVNYGSRVPPKVSTLTFAHEVGHNFGSPHDSGESCVPTSTNPNTAGGNYIMFASATSGDKTNNHRFSNCSIGNMTQVLQAVLSEQYGKYNCFKNDGEAFCGNRIVEGDEECDCGFTADCEILNDKCCNPQEKEEGFCRLINGMKCSISQGPCCNEDCSFVSSDRNKTMCQGERECSEASYCNGRNATCPDPTPKADFTLCNSNTQICKRGECSGSVCEKVNWQPCFIDAPTNEKNYDRGLLCFVSCFNAETRQCVSTGSQSDLRLSENKPLLNLLHDLGFNNSGIKMPAGMACDNYRGYCDVFQKCRAVNEDGPLARLKNLLFNDKTISEIRDWMTRWWWAVLLMALGVVIAMGLFIKLCAVHTPSSNPKQTPARKLTLPRRHAHRPQGPPPPYSESGHGRAGGPPHGGRQSRGRQQGHRHDIEMKHRQGDQRL